MEQECLWFLYQFGALVVDVEFFDLPAAEACVFEGEAHFACKVGIVFVNYRHRGGTCARDISGVSAVSISYIEHLAAVRDKFHAVRLMEAVVNSGAEVLELTCKEGSGEEGSAGEVIDSVAVGDFFREASSCVLSFKFKIGYHSDEFKFCEDLLFYPMNFSAVEYSGHDTAEESGGSIIGVTLDLSGEINEVIGSERGTEEGISADEACDDASG